jgi:hypothetical protein
MNLHKTLRLCIVQATCQFGTSLSENKRGHSNNQPKTTTKIDVRKTIVQSKLYIKQYCCILL